MTGLRPPLLFGNLISYNHKWRRLDFGGSTCADGISSRLLPFRQPDGRFRHAHSAGRSRASVCSCVSDDAEGRARITAFRQGLQKLAWTEGQNVRLDVRWAAGDAALERKFAAELVALAPDVILATASPTVAAAFGAVDVRHIELADEIAEDDRAIASRRRPSHGTRSRKQKSLLAFRSPS